MKLGHLGDDELSQEGTDVDRNIKDVEEDILGGFLGGEVLITTVGRNAGLDSTSTDSDNQHRQEGQKVGDLANGSDKAGDSKDCNHDHTDEVNGRESNDGPPEFNKENKKISGEDLFFFFLIKTRLINTRKKRESS
jgi:hypothetical protein